MSSSVVLILWTLLSVSAADMMTGYGDNLFGHKTSYLWVFSNQTSSRNEFMTINRNGKTCTAVQLNYMGRHGARYPGKEDFHYFEELRNRILHNSVTTQYTTFLQNWQDYPSKASGHIEDIGRVEMNDLGDFYGNGLFDLFNGHISNSTIKLVGSNKKRTRTSASEFYKGLTKVITGTGLSDIKPLVNDELMKYYEMCPLYDASVTNNVTNQREIGSFINSTYFQGVIKDLTSKLGMNTSLTYNDVLEIFLLCATDLAVRNKTDWCSMLSLKEIDIINYENDLWDYYNLMYGHPMIQRITCPLWNDIFSSLDTAIHNNDNNRPYLLGDLRFGHSHTLDPFYAALGLFHDSEPLRADNYPSMKDRIFYESKVTPFAAHVAFILYNCGGHGPNSYMLKMFVNGQPTVIPRCGSDTCLYSDVKLRYRQYIDQCNFKEMCTLTKPAVG